MQHSYGWIPQLPDQRDIQLTLPSLEVSLPPVVDLRRLQSPVYDQGRLGSCTANMLAAAVDYERQRQGLQYAYPSRLFQYYNERLLEHTVKTDSGASIRDTYKAANRYGICPETAWPYDISRFARRPAPSCYTQARQDLVLQYAAVPQRVQVMQQALASGLCIGVGISIYESFETVTNGVIPMPGMGEQLLGGHAVLVVGYDQSTWLVRNSWGTAWGMQGYFTLPMPYLANPYLSGDFWAIQLVSS